MSPRQQEPLENAETPRTYSLARCFPIAFRTYPSRANSSLFRAEYSVIPDEPSDTCPL